MIEGQDQKREQKEDEPNWLKLSRSLGEQYAKSRPKPLNLTHEEMMAQMAARYKPFQKKEKQ